MPTRSDARQGKYVPALGFRALTRFYDRAVSLMLPEKSLRRKLIAQAQVRPGHRVLDLGCGTGTFALMLKQTIPEAQVIGLDGDPEVLHLARQKASAAGVEIELTEGLSFDPPFEPATFDRVISTLMFHHLTRDQKLKTLERMRGLLRSRGEIHIADWGVPQNRLMRVAFLSVQALDGFQTTADSVTGILPSLMVQAGFEDVCEAHREGTAFGTLAMYRGVVA